MNIGSYSSIYNLGHKAVENIFNGNVEITEKVDGCFTRRTPVWLANYKLMYIDKVVRQKVDAVIGYDVKTDTFKPCKILNTFKYPASHKTLVDVHLKGVVVPQPSKIKCTPDHLIYTNRGWVAAANLVKGDRVYCHRKWVKKRPNRYIGYDIIPQQYVNYKEVERISEPFYTDQALYDIETELNTYLVGQLGFIVHNSQISFSRDNNNELSIRSKRQTVYEDAPEKLFATAVESIKKLPLKTDYIYRGEYLQKPRHNCLSYNRVPKNNIIIYNIDAGDQKYLSYDNMKREAEELGLETAPLLFYGKISSLNELEELLSLESILGGTKIEGIVIKNYELFGLDKKIVMAKLVSDVFKEKLKVDFRQNKTTSGDIIIDISKAYATEARWQKAVQHLREDGVLKQEPSDIGRLIMEVQEDVMKECEGEIKNILWKWAKPNIVRRLTHGLPEWYKNKLLEVQKCGDQNG